MLLHEVEKGEVIVEKLLKYMVRLKDSKNYF